MTTDFVADTGKIPQDSSQVAGMGYEQNTPVEDLSPLFGINAGTSGLIGRFAARHAYTNYEGPEMPAEEINKQYGPTGNDGKQVKITDTPMTAASGAMIGEAKQREIQRDNIMQRFSNQHGMLATFGLGAAAFLSDPLNAASTFIPGFGEETTGAALARLGAGSFAAKTGGRIVAGATGGAAAQAPITALKYGLGREEASDYDLRSSFSDMANSAVLGAIFHAGFGAAGDAWKAGRSKIEGAPGQATTPEAAAIINSDGAAKDAAMRSSVAQVVGGREVDAESVLGKDGTPPDLQNLAQKQSEIYRQGAVPGMSSDELEHATNEVLPTPESAQKAPGEEDQPSRLPPEVIDRYKGTISDFAKKNGIPLDDGMLQRAARAMAESYNPEAPPLPAVKVEPQENAEKPQKVAQTGQENASNTPKIALNEPFNPPNLPRELSRAAPRYGKGKLNFESDVDKALYIVNKQSSKQSAAHDKYMDYLKNQVGLSDKEIDRGGRMIKDAIKRHASTASGDEIAVPKTFHREPVAELPAAKAPEAYSPIPPEPTRLATFARQAGGLQDEGGDVRAMLGGARFRPGLVNKAGKSLDDMARAAQEAGYFPEHGEERVDTNTFLERLREDLAGNVRYSEHDLEAANAYHEALRNNSEIDRISHETGIDPKGKTPEEFWDEVAKQKPEEEEKLVSAMSDSWQLESVEPEELEGLEHEYEQSKGAQDVEPIPSGNAGSGRGSGAAGAGEEGLRSEPVGSESSGREGEAGGPEQPGEGAGANGNAGATELHPDDAAIAQLEMQLDLSKLTGEERADIAGATANYKNASDIFDQKRQALAACLVGEVG